MLAIREHIQGRLDMAAGRWGEARAKFDSVDGIFARIGRPSVVNALDQAEAALSVGDSDRALTEARGALEFAKSLQGDLAYSNLTGLSWLMLGRVLQARGESAEAAKALQAAVENLSNTVDADHPQLVLARKLLR